MAAAEDAPEDRQAQASVAVADANLAGGAGGTWVCCLPCGWLRRSRPVRRAALSAATLAVTSLLVASPVLFLSAAAPTNTPRHDCATDDDSCLSRMLESGAGPGMVCNTAVCRHAAAKLSAAVDWSSDPCKDFYNFACGGAAATEGAPLSLATLQRHVDSHVQQLLVEATTGRYQKLGRFYNSCLMAREQKRSSKPMWALLESLGGYLTPEVADPTDLAPVVSSLLKLNSAPLFDVYLDRSPLDRASYAIFIDIPRTIQISHELSKSYGNFQINRTRRSHGKESRAYIFLKERAEEKRLVRLESFLQKFIPVSLTLEERAKEAQSVLHFASILNKIFPREKDILIRAQLANPYRQFNFSGLEENYGFLDWKLLMDSLFATNFTGSEVFYVTVPDYFTNLRTTLTKFSKRTVHNAVLALFAGDSLLELVDAAAVAKDDAGCVRVSVSLFSREVAALYVQQFPQQLLNDLKSQATHLLERLRLTLKSRVLHLPWLDAGSREAALRKIRKIQAHLLTLPRLWNESFVSELLRQIKVDPNDYFENVIQRNRQLRESHFKLLEQPAEDRRWAYPFVVNAFYDQTVNSIVVPLALIAQPYMRTDVPRYVTLGSAGTALAHELLHVLDLVGVDRDEHGDVAPWMAGATRLRLEARLDCLARQYGSSFLKTITFLGSKVPVQFDWNVTRNENMADVCGLQVAFQAWRSQQEMTSAADLRLPGVDLSPSQLFFLHSAQIYCSALSPEDYIILVEMDFHTPNPERVNGMVMNSPEFSEAYNCPLGSPMNPIKKCSVW